MRLHLPGLALGAGSCPRFRHHDDILRAIGERVASLLILGGTQMVALREREIAVDQ